MRIFIRHIIRSIKRSPIQPIIIVIALTAALLSFIIGCKMIINVGGEIRHQKKEDDYICDITVKSSASDSLRMMFLEDIEDIIGNDGQAIGEFNITGLMLFWGNGEVVNLCASDMQKADLFYDLKYIEYRRITDKNINNSIILSSKAAEKYELEIGDVFTINLLNCHFNFTIEAIAASNGILRECEGIINIGAITKALSDANPAISSLGDALVPYTTIRITLNDKDRIDDYISRISSSEEFESKIITKEADSLGAVDFFTTTSLCVILLSVIIIIALSALIIATSVDILNVQRRRDTALFMTCGASLGDLRKILLLEYGIYTFMASVLALLLSIPIADAINQIYTWTVAGLSFKFYDIFFALIGGPVIILVTELIRGLTESRQSVSELLEPGASQRGKAGKVKFIIVLGCVSVLILILTLLLPVEKRLISSLLALVLFSAFAYVLLPFIIKAISLAVANLLTKLKKIPSLLLIALKNLKESYPLIQTTRLIVIFASVSMMVLVCLGAMDNEVRLVESIADCDYISYGTNDSTDMIIEELDAVESSFRISFFKDLITEKNTGVLTISASKDALPYINQKLRPKKLPEGNEIVISKGVAMLYSSGVGDEILMNNNGITYSFKIIEIIPAHANFAIVDAEYLGGSNDFLCIRAKEQISDTEYTELANAMEIQGASINDPIVVFSSLISRINSYITVMRYVMMLSMITTSLGIVNLIISSHISRRRDRHLYYVAGMTKTSVTLLEITEFAVIILLSLLLVPILGGSMTWIFDLASNALGLDLLI